MNIRTMGLVLLLALLRTAPSSANVTALDVKLTDPSPVLSGFNSNDLHIDFNGFLTEQQLVIQLTGGSIYQDGFGSDTAPSGIVVPQFPAVAYDSFVTLGGLTQGTSYPVITGPGTFISCNPLAGCAFNVAWIPGTGTVVPAAKDFVVARITLSDDAEGVVHYYGSTTAGISFPDFISGSIHNGIISFVPEPASWMFVAWAAMAAVGCSRRRSRYFSRAIVRYSS
jgi:hypothetical protein